MALKVWLPLNKDTRNVGLNNVKATNNGATLTNGGVYNDCYHFGTSSSYMTLPPSCMTGFTTACTVSFWLRIKTWNTSYATFFQAGKGGSPWANYVFGFLRNSSTSTICFTISNSASTSSQSNYLTSAISLNTWYHVVLAYETGKIKIYLNGSIDHQYTTTIVPHFSGITKITLGTCNATSSYQTDCDMNDLRIYDHALSESDVLRIYNNRSIFEIPYSQETEKPEYSLWLKLLHHNAPANQVFTTANYKKNSDNDLYSRCGWMFGNTIFKLDNDKYEMLAKEKLESGSTENIFRWTQTSSPTASTITGFSAITNVSGSHLLGLKHNGSYAALHNGSSYWCACGSYTAYQGGTLGFQGVVKTGYMDLFVRAEIKHLPSKYEELEWVKFAPGQYINTELAIVAGDATITKAKMRYETGESGRDLMGWSPSAANYWGVTSGGTWEKIVFTNSDITALNYLTYTYTAANNGTYQICALQGSHSTRSKYIYNFKIYVNGDLKRNMIPCIRKSDSKVGMYDLVTKKFYTHTGSGNLVAGPTKQYIPKEYEQLEYIESNGSQWIDTGINPKIKPRVVAKMAILNSADKDYWGNSAIDGSAYYADFKSYRLMYYRYGSTTYQSVNFAVGQNEIHVWDVSDKVYVDGSLKFTSTNTYTYSSSQSTIQIFKAARASYYSSYKLYNFKLYDGDELCRNFVPSKRKSDNVIGLYDTVSRQFFTNAGNGSFTGA